MLNLRNIATELVLSCFLIEFFNITQLFKHITIKISFLKFKKKNSLFLNILWNGYRPRFPNSKKYNYVLTFRSLAYFNDINRV